MKESTSFFSLFSPSNETFMQVCENSKELCKHRAWKNCENTARERAVQTPRVEELWKHRAWKNCGNTARGRAVQTLRVEELWKHRAWKSCANTARGRTMETPRVDELWKHRAWKSSANTARGRTVETPSVGELCKTPRVEECLHFCILVFSNTHSCSISKIYNDNYILATDDIIFDISQCTLDHQV